MCLTPVARKYSCSFWYQLVVVSHSMRQLVTGLLANGFQLTSYCIESSRHHYPRGWPVSMSDLADPSASALAQWLLEQMPQRTIVVLIRYSGNEAAFYCHGLGPAVMPAPDGYIPESRAALDHGALLCAYMNLSGGGVPPCADARIGSPTVIRS